MGLRSTFDVTLAADGQDAVDIFLRTGADAIVLDGTMPRMSGYEACAQIRMLPAGKKVPICIVTSSDEADAIDRAFASGANDFFLKPVHLGVLARKIQALIDQDKGAREEGMPGPEDLVFDALPLPAALVDTDGHILRVNRSFVRQFRSTPKDEETWHNFFTPAEGLADDGGSFRALFEGRRYSLTLTALPPGLGANRLLLAIEAPAAANQPRVQVHRHAKSARILVLEDQELVQRSIVRLLSRSDHRITVVQDAQGAVSTFQEARASGDPYRLVLLDLSIPGSEGGSEVLQSLRKVDGTVRAIATSGSWDDPVMNHPALYGFEGVLPKPFNREELMGKIDEVLNAE